MIQFGAGKDNSILSSRDLNWVFTSLGMQFSGNLLDNTTYHIKLRNHSVDQITRITEWERLLSLTAYSFPISPYTSTLENQ